MTNGIELVYEVQGGNMRSKRIAITLSDDKLELVERYASDTGMSLSQYCLLCVGIGLKTMKRINEPENIYTPEQQAALMAALGIDKQKVEELIKQQIGLLDMRSN